MYFFANYLLQETYIFAYFVVITYISLQLLALEVFFFFLNEQKEKSQLQTMA